MSSDGAAARPRPDYLRTAVSPRMLGLLLVLMLAAAACARLGVWQLERAQVRGEASARSEAQAQGSGPPTPLAEVLEPQTPFPGELVGRRVQTSGTFDAVNQLLVPGRAHENRSGYLVLTPLRVGEPGAGTAGGEADAEAPDGGDARRPVLPVVRGWVPTVEAAAALDPPPGGPVSVTGYLQAGEASGEAGLPVGQVGGISPGELVNRWGGPIYTGYLVVSAVDPTQDTDIALLDPPTLAGSDLNLQNVAYALQWWLFGGFALLLWLRLVRDEAVEAEEGEEEGPDDAPLPSAGAGDAVSPSPAPAADARP